MSEIDLSLIAPKPSGLRGATRAPARDDPKLAQAAKDFESVLLAKMMEEMHNTVEDSGLLEDSGSGQAQGMFWTFLAKNVADKGGLGLWKDLYDQWSRQGASAPRAPAAAEVLP